MPLRIWIEMGILGFLLLLALAIYFYAKKKIDDAESQIEIRKKKDIKDKLKE